MLPLVIDEQQVFIFKFWFDGKIQDGMHFQNELFCQIGTFGVSERSRVYQAACKLAHQGTLLAITCSDTTCRVWGNLRDETVKQLLVNPSVLGLDRSTLLQTANLGLFE